MDSVQQEAGAGVPGPQLLVHVQRSLRAPREPWNRRCGQRGGSRPEEPVRLHLPKLPDQRRTGAIPSTATTTKIKHLATNLTTKVNALYNRNRKPPREPPADTVETPPVITD